MDTNGNGLGVELWQPKKNSRICSNHFVNNTKSNHPGSSSYIPTLFPNTKPKSKVAWSRAQTSILIEEYKKYPSLYTSKHKEYYNKHIRSVFLSKIVQALQTVRPGVTESDVIHKWNALRTRYAETRRKILPSSRNGLEDDGHNSGLWYYNKMEFLDEHLNNGTNVVKSDNHNVSIPEYEQTEEFEPEIETNMWENNLVVPSDPLSSSETMSTISIKEEIPASPPPSKKRREEEIFSTVSERIEKVEDSVVQMQTLSCKDESDIFGDFVALQLKKITDENTRQDVILEIHQVLHRALRTK